MALSVRALFSRNTGSRYIAVGVGSVLLGWAGGTMVLLLLMFPLRPGNVFTWWVLMLWPAAAVVIAVPLYFAQPAFRQLNRVPVFPRMLLMIVAGMLLLMALVIYGHQLGALWPFKLTMPFRVVRWQFW